MPYRALVVGAGQIGARYDSPGPAAPLTYAHALAKNPEFELVGFVDTSQERGSLAVERWGGRWFPSLASAWQQSTFEAVCVAIPDDCHHQLLCELASYPFKILLAEKPFTTRPDQAREVLNLYEGRKTPVLINYSRRYVPAFTLLAQSIRDGQFGHLLQANGYYGKGSLHNGSHMVNLLLYLFGEVSFVKRFHSTVDYQRADPTASVLLSTGPSRIPITLHAVDSRAVSIFELDLLFSSQRIRMIQSGAFLEFFELRENPDFPGYRNYSLVRTEETGLFNAMSKLVELAHTILEGSWPPERDLLDAVTTLEICRQFLA